MGLSKCQCDKPGFCEVFNKEMGTKPPNWQWCQQATQKERERYLAAHSKSVRIILKATTPGFADVVNFYDEIPEPKGDFAIVTVAANDYAMEHLDVGRESILEYAKMCGADYIELTGDQNPDWPISNKWRCEAVSRKYKKTLFMDCDMVVMPNCPDLFKETPDDKISVVNEIQYFMQPVGGVLDGLKWIKYEQEMIIDKMKIEPTLPVGHHMLNGGLIMIPRELSKYYAQPKTEYPKLWCFDQQLLSLTIPKDKLNYLDSKFNWEFIGQDFWEGLPDCYIAHVNYAKPNGYRVGLLKRIVNKNYAKVENGLIQPDPNIIKWLNSESVGYFTVFVPQKDKKPPERVDKNLVVTVACGDEFEKIIEVTGPIINDYADKIGADFLVIKGETQDYPYYEKFRIHPFVKAYNRTLFIDADVVVDPDSPNIFDEVPDDRVGIFCDYQYNHENSVIYSNDDHLLRFNYERRQVIRSFIKDDRQYSDYISRVENKTLLNSGVVVCSRQHADLWSPVFQPCVKFKLTEQFIIEMRSIMMSEVVKLDKKWNCQPWFPRDLFFERGSHVVHLAGWCDTNPLPETKGFVYSGLSRLDMINRIINEKSTLFT